MVIYEKVCGTMQSVLPIEINIDTVYLREKPVKVVASKEVPEHWEYRETQMTLNEYIDYLQQDVSAKDLDNKMAITEVYELLLNGGAVK
ncbi:MAG: hypothetical protein RR128_08805 [Clostridium sp.]